MTDAQIKDAIRNGWVFFAMTPQGDILARYLPFGPVFRWQKNHMLPTPLQGEDLCWWLQAAGEEGHSIAGDDAGEAPEGER